MAIKYLDFDLLIERSADRYRARVLGSPAGQASIEFSPPFTESEIDAFFLQIGQTRSIESEEARRIREKKLSSSPPEERCSACWPS